MPHRRAAPPRRSGLAAFTLIEILAVVLILGLLSSLLGPPLGLRSGRALEQAADEIGAACEFARQRAILTGRAHRVVLDFDWNLHRVEWLAPPEADAGAPPVSQAIELSPPLHELGDFSPVPGGLGRDARLPDGVDLLVVELPGREVNEGWLGLHFDPDGTSDHAVIWLGEPDARARRVVEVLPLADAVVVHDAEA